MRRCPTAVVLLLTAALASWTSIAMAQSAPLSPSGEAAFAHVQHLAGVIGPRIAGAQSERQAAEYLSAQLRQYGYPVELHQFQMPYFEARKVEVSQLAPGARTFTSQALMLSAPSPAAGTEGEVVFVGLGGASDVDGKQLRGAVALIERGTSTFREKVANVAARGAVAAIVYNNQPGIISGTLGQRSEIPAVAISQEDGRRLAEAAQGGRVRVRVLVDALFETRQGINVVATKRGAQRPDEIIVIGGHYDSVPAAPGANDNASGTAVVLEVARVLANTPLPRTVQFVLFGAEELGLHGSAAFVSDRRQGIVAMVNLDMVGWGDRLMVGASQGRDDSIVNLAERVAQRLGIAVTKTRMSASDHASFERAGVPVAFLHRGVDPYYHQAGDVPANVTPRNLEEVARLSVGILQELTQTRSGAVRSSAAARRPAAI
jgi:aminopeptidase YwaD